MALLFFALGLMSKPMLVTLPFALLLLDYWPLERSRWGRRNKSEIRNPKQSQNPKGRVVPSRTEDVSAGRASAFGIRHSGRLSVMPFYVRGRRVSGGSALSANTNRALAEPRGVLADACIGLTHRDCGLARARIRLADCRSPSSHCKIWLADANGGLTDATVGLADAYGRLSNANRCLADPATLLPDTNRCAAEARNRLREEGIVLASARTTVLAEMMPVQ
jgi:hypothetical protein